jgi:hypothetical protein
MNTVIDLRSELLIDRSTVSDPFLRLIARALGKAFIGGSYWVTVNKLDLERNYCGTSVPRMDMKPLQPHLTK